MWLSQLKHQLCKARDGSVGQGPVAPLPALKHAWIASAGPVIFTLRDLPLLLQNYFTLFACVFLCTPIAQRVPILTSEMIAVALTGAQTHG